MVEIGSADHGKEADVAADLNATDADFYDSAAAICVEERDGLVSCS